MKKLDKKELNKIIILGFLLITCFFLTYYFHFILKAEIVFTHLFYIPIILASLWWTRKGIIIAVSLAVMLLFLDLVAPTNVPIYLDLMRASMFIIVSIIIGTLSEKRYLLESKLRVYSKNLEERVEERTAALRESKDLLDKIINSNPDWIFVKDKDYRYILVNEGYVSALGKSKEELIGKNDIEVGFPKELVFGNPDKDIAGFRSDDQRVLEGETIHNEYDPATAADGTLHIFDTYKISLRDSHGNVYAVLGYARDITERKRAEERIEKIQSLRNAISDINQLLVRVKNESELFQQICNFLIEVKEIRFVWIGLTNTENFQVKPVAQAGFEEGYLSLIKVTWDDSKYGNGPTGIALKTLRPFIMRNIEDDPKFKPWKNDALKRGYLSSIALPLIYKKETIGALNVYSGVKDAFTNEEIKFLKEVSEDIAIGIRSLRVELKLQQSYQKLKKTIDAAIETMSKIIEAKDPYTAGHQQRVSQLATAIAKELNFSKDKVEEIRVASLIHDIGKIGLPTEILSKPSKLSDIEYNLIKSHSQIGYEILKDIDFSYPIARIVLQHHEKIDGSGYPNNLKGNKILLESKIIGVADVIEAMSSHRPYRPALGIDKALEEVSQNRGIFYDPEVVDAGLRLFKGKGFKFK